MSGCVDFLFTKILMKPLHCIDLNDGQNVVIAMHWIVPAYLRSREKKGRQPRNTCTEFECTLQSQKDFKECKECGILQAAVQQMWKFVEPHDKS